MKKSAPFRLSIFASIFADIAAKADFLVATKTCMIVLVIIGLFQFKSISPSFDDESIYSNGQIMVAQSFQRLFTSLQMATQSLHCFLIFLITNLTPPIYQQKTHCNRSCIQQSKTMNNFH